MLNLLSVENIAVTILGYPMSYIELTGTLLYLWSVRLISRRRMLTWPVGIVSVLLYMALFYQIRLYSDALEQIYYLVASGYGWWVWHHSPRSGDTVLDVRFSSPAWIAAAISATLVLSGVLGYGMTQVHLYLPALFPAPADYPYADAFTTVLSFTAMWVMARKRIESWLYWIVVDLIGIGLYYLKDVRFVALLYVILLGMAINGFWAWRRAMGVRERPVLRAGGLGKEIYHD